MIDIAALVNDTQLNGLISFSIRFLGMVIITYVLFKSLKQFRTKRLYKYKITMSSILLLILIALTSAIYQQLLKLLDLNYLFLTPYVNIISAFALLLIAIAFNYLYLKEKKQEQ